jgi:hypothetical protein
LNENFASGIPGTWTIVDGGSGGGTAATWTTANPGSRAAVAPITTPFAIVDSTAAGGAATQDEQLITPVLNLSGASSVTLEFDQYFSFFVFGPSEKGDVDVRSSATGNAWVNVLRNMATSPTNPEHKTLNITAQAAGASNVQIRFRYFDGQNDNYWMVDNVKVTHPASAECTIVSCSAAAAPPEVTNLRFSSKTSATWDSAAGATNYNFYRGVSIDLPKLYTAVTDSCVRVSTGSTSAASLTDVPASGSAAYFWWLVRASNASGLGPAGSGTAGPRVHDSSGVCP